MPIRPLHIFLIVLVGLSISFPGQSVRGQDHEIIYLDTMDITVHEVNSRYQPSRKRLIDIEHIRLEVKPFFERKTMYGKAFINLRPYNLPIQQVELDAKGMNIRQIFIMHPEGFIPLKYTYDSLLLTIDLHRTYNKEEQFTLFIEYVAEPYKLADKNIELSAGRGLYFIDPLDKNPYKPTQMWTQGETNANSVWMPVVDSPNEQFTQEIFITVDERYTTLSNGLLVGTEFNNDGTKTDHWEQSKPHGPHLAMIAAGKFHMTMDDWGPIKLYYYTTEEFSKDVRKVFGQTPYMMSYFSKVLQMDFPWEKYAQMVVYDYTSGAMENTTAVIYYDAYYADRYDLLDRNYDETIAHELMHQWFGNVVSCESWAHLAINESFATYGEYLWYDHKYSRDHADHMQHEYLFSYLNEFMYKSEPIVNFYYDDAEELFDAHRYEKGSCVLHMLRDYMGDAMFFDGLSHFLKTNKYHSAEIGDLRLSLEKVSGEDLYWFFEQWFMEPGHPVVKIARTYDAAKREAVVSIDQIQDITRYNTFQFPLSIDIYADGKVERHQVWVDQRKETFRLPVSGRPDLVNVDAKKIMLWEKEEEEKTRDELIFQYRNAPLYVDRLEAISGLRFRQGDKKARAEFMAALDDKFWHIRQYALNNMELESYHAEEGSIEKISLLALSDPVPRVRRAAVEALNELNPTYAVPVADSLFHHDSSRMVIATAINVLFQQQPEKIYPKLTRFESQRNYYLVNGLAAVYAELGDRTKDHFFRRAIQSTRPYYMAPIMDGYVRFLERMDAATINDAALFLREVAHHEETDFLRDQARNALYNLQEHFARRQGEEEKAGILKSVIDNL